MHKYLYSITILLAIVLPLNSQNWLQMSIAKKPGGGSGSFTSINSITELNDTLYLATDNGVWFSPSGNGGDWAQFGTGLTTDITELALVNNVKLARTTASPSQVYRLSSTKVWTLVPTLTAIGSIAAQATSGYGFATKDGTGVYRTTDKGVTWSLYNTPSDNENLIGDAGTKGIIPGLRIWRVYPSGNLLLAQSKNALHISEDNGNSWYYRWGDMVIDHNTGSNIKWTYLRNYKGKNYVFVASDGSNWNGMSPNISRSDNMGVNYQYSDNPSAPTITGLIYSNNAHFRDMCSYGEKAMFLRCDNETIFKSNDNGLTWINFEPGLSAWSYMKLISTSKKLILACASSIWYFDYNYSPTMTVGYPKVSNIKGGSMDLKVKSNQAGLSYYVVLPASAAAPTAQQVIDGLDANGDMASIKGNFSLLANTEAINNVKNLLALTAYKVYTVATNEIGNATTINSASFSTISPYLTVSKTGLGDVTPTSGYYTGNVTLTATPSTNYILDTWTVNEKIYSTPSVNLNMTTDFTATALFTKVAPVTVSYTGMGSTFPAATSNQKIGAYITVRAYPALGYKVTKWTVNGVSTTTSSQSRAFLVLDQTNTIAVQFDLISAPALEICDSMILVSDLKRPGMEAAASFNARINEMYGARIPSYSDSRSYAGSDVGKFYWSEKMAKMAMNPNNQAALIATVTPALAYRSPGAGSFWYPFTAPGYAMYYFTFKDSIAKYAPAQLDTIENTFYKQQEWKYLMRKDHYLDMVYPTGKEFNSENFHWMLRSAGYLFASEFQNKNGHDNYNLNFTDADGTPRTNVNVTGYFNGYLNNLTRALYSSGRVEWNSNVYWSHTLNALLALYQGADKCNNPDGVEAKKKAKACIDWMMVEAALHYLDGFQIAADARAKNGYLENTPGSTEAYTYAFFTDDNYRPSYSPSFWADNQAATDVAGFLLNTDYRPPQLAIDIAQKKFTLPVEIQSAKPYYQVDFGDYWSLGEYPYQDWAGNTARSKRFEFETLYLGQNFTMSSVAGGRPDGNIGTFSEQAQWEIGVKGSINGPKQISGKPNYGTSLAGRCPYHEIGQFRNMMAHLVKLPSSNQFYILIPDANNQLVSSGAGSWFEWDNQNLYLDLGNDVYMACKLNNATTHAVTTSTRSEVRWTFPDGELGALVLELGTKAEFASFDNFKTQAKLKNIAVVATNTVQYLGAAGQTLKMEYTEPGSYLMANNTFDTPSTNPLSPAGNYPKVWGNGTYIDFQTWDSYRTVYGEAIISQAWGDAKMILKVADEEATIKVDKVTANVNYLSSNSTAPKPCADITYVAPNSFQNNTVLDPAYAVSSVQWDFNEDLLWDLSGAGVSYNYPTSGTKTVNIKVTTNKNCYYQNSKIIDVVLTDVKTTQMDKGVMIYPNPTSAIVFFETNNTMLGAELSVHDLMGRMLKKEVIDANVIPLNLNGYAEGMYTVQIKTKSDGIYSYKVILKK